MPNKRASNKSIKNTQNRQKSQDSIDDMNNIHQLGVMTFVDPYIHQLQNTHTFQVHMKYFP